MLNFENASILSYNQTSSFFGNSFRYQNQKNLTIEGILRVTGNTSGVSGMQNAISGFFRNDIDYTPVIVNGYNFGRGKINSVSMSEGNDVRVKPYTVSVTCYETGNLYNLTGIYYSGIGQSTGNRYDLINDFSENFSFNRDGETYGYTHDISIQLNSGFGVTQTPINLAKAFATSLINNNVPFGFLTSGENQLLGFKVYNESYNRINNQCSFTETYSRPKNTSGLLFTRVNSYDLGPDGITRVSENGNIKNISGNLAPSRFTGLAALVDTISSGAYARCNSIFTSYSSPTSYPLYSGYESYTKSINHFANTASYDISFSNNPVQISGCSWRYSNEITKEDRFYSVTENGSIIGHGIPQNSGYQAAMNIYNNVKAGAFTRNYQFYASNVSYPLSLKRVAESKNYSQFNGNVDYSFSFSDNPINNEGVSGIKTREISVNDSIPMKLINKFQIFNTAEIVQAQENATLGNRSLNLQFSLTKDHNFTTVKSAAKQIVNSYIPVEEDSFINSLDFSYNPNQKRFSLNVGWTFQRDPMTNFL